MTERYDLAVVGAGILGLAHALAAAKAGLRVIVLERDQRAVGASIRNFGFVTVTGQQRGECYRRAMRSRDIWDAVATEAGIPVIHRGLALAAHGDDSLAVLQAFVADAEMGPGCELLDPDTALRRLPMLKPDRLRGVLWSPHERRVDPRHAITILTRYLEEAHGVVFRFGVNVLGAEPPTVETRSGSVHADRIVVCPGADFGGPLADRIAALGLTKCKLHMLRLAAPGWRLPASIMSETSLPRYLGYAELSAAQPVKERIARDRPDLVAHGIHLIVTQDADGSLVVGDSHHYGDPPDPFVSEAVDDLIIDLARETIDLPEIKVVQRWTGVYASAENALAVIDRPSDRMRLALVTSGTGMSTAFAIGEEVVDELFDTGTAKSARTA